MLDTTCNTMEFVDGSDCRCACASDLYTILLLIKRVPVRQLSSLWSSLLSILEFLIVAVTKRVRARLPDRALGDLVDQALPALA